MSQLIEGNSLDVLKEFPDNYFSSCITDPPYELGFMGKKWDQSGIAYSQDLWSEVLRVLKPGAYLLSFGGTRTYHRMACAIEDAGFEIRDCIDWIYGSGFPKSLSIDKAIDKTNGEMGRSLKFTKWMRSTGISAKQINDVTDSFMGSHYLTDKNQPAIPTPDLWVKIRPMCGDIPAWVDELVERIEAKREVIGKSDHASGIGQETKGHYTVGGKKAEFFDITAPPPPPPSNGPDGARLLSPLMSR